MMRRKKGRKEERKEIRKTLFIYIALHSTPWHNITCSSWNVSYSCVGLSSMEYRSCLIFSITSSLSRSIGRPEKGGGRRRRRVERE